MVQLPGVVDCHAHLDRKHLANGGFGLDQILGRCERFGVEAVVSSLYLGLNNAQPELPLESIEQIAARHE